MLRFAVSRQQPAAVSGFSQFAVRGSQVAKLRLWGYDALML